MNQMLGSSKLLVCYCYLFFHIKGGGGGVSWIVAWIVALLLVLGLELGLYGVLAPAAATIGVCEATVLSPPLLTSPLLGLPGRGFVPLSKNSCASSPINKIRSTTVLKLSQARHCTPQKCHARFVCVDSQSLHIIDTTLHNSGGTGWEAIPAAIASHVGFIRSCDSAVFLQMGHRLS